MIKVGRYTAGLLIISVGGSMLLEQAAGGDYLSWIGKWWPAFLIALGLEYLFYVNLNKGEDRPMKLDLSGLLISILLSFVVVGIARIPQVIDAVKHSELADVLPAEWFGTDAEPSGTAVTKDPFAIPFNGNVKKLTLHNVYGNVTIREGADLNDISVQTLVWDKTDAKDETSRSNVSYELSGDSLAISAEELTNKKGLFGNRRNRVDLTVIIPPGREAKYEVEVTSGAIEAAELHGDVKLVTVNGSIKANSIHGDLEAETKHGSVDVTGVTGRLKAESTVSAISVESDTVGGDWDVSNVVGSVSLNLPANASFTLKGSAMGRIDSDFAIQSDHNDFNGKNGTGEHDIQVETHGSLTVKRLN